FAASGAACHCIWGALPTLGDIWPLAVLIPLLAGAAVTFWAGGTVLYKRIIQAAICGAVIGAAYPGASSLLRLLFYGGAGTAATLQTLKQYAMDMLWPAFLLAIFCAVGAIWTEVKLPEPRVPGSLQQL
ncbi:MAG: hypothetical protein KAU28_04635, partial [Phycisphaerae bacterium]|nr:hypothetical protein [Phycisphaerae bacterium]